MAKKDMRTVRCYRCSIQYEADIARLDTQCPECGSDSFVPVRNR